MTAYSEAIKAHLADADLQVQEFAEMLGVKQPTVTRYKEGERFPDAEMARKIEMATGGKVSFELWLSIFKERVGLGEAA